MNVNMNIYRLHVTLNEIHGSIWWLNFVSLPSSFKLFVFLLDFDLLEKNPSVKLFFFLNSSHFCAITSIFWLICTISDSQSGIKFMISTPVKLPTRNFLPDRINVRLKVKGNIWYIHDFLKVVGNNIRVLFLIFDWLHWPFNAAVIVWFWYFNNNFFCVITFSCFWQL